MVAAPAGMVTVSGGGVGADGGGAEPALCGMFPYGLSLDAVSSSVGAPSRPRFGMAEFRQAAVALGDLLSTAGGWTRRGPAE